MVRRRFLDALGERLAIPSEALGSSAARVHLLRRCGVTSEAARAVDALVARLDGAAFGGAAAGSARALAGEASALVARVDAEACGDTRPAAPAPRERPAWAVRAAWGAVAALLAVAVVAVGTGRGPRPADDPDAVQRIVSRRDPRPAFARGLDAAGRGQWGIAARAFRDAAAARPRSPDAWANAGSAAWVAGDTVQAAAAWHRALRLAPRAADVRARLALLPASDGGAIAAVPPVPANWGAAAALGAWWLAGLALALALAGRGRARRVGRAVAWRAAAVAGLAAAVTAWLAGTQTLRARAVVAEGGPLRAEPALGADPVGQTTLADLARVDARQAAWARVSLDGGRSGWVETARLVPLE